MDFSSWQRSDWIASAAVGISMLALVVSFTRTWLVFRRGSRKLRVDATLVHDAEDLIAGLSKAVGEKPWNHAHGHALWDLVVTNHRAGTTHLKDAGLVIKNSLGKKTDLPATVRSPHYEHHRLTSLDQGAITEVKGYGHYRCQVWVWRKHPEEWPKKVLKLYVVDQTGKRWEYRYRGRQLRILEKPVEETMNADVSD